jgi:hypothetical protein
MLREQTAVYDPEELSLLSNILDRAVATLPPDMQTPANRMEIAKIILTHAASGEIALAPLMKDAGLLAAILPPGQAAHCDRQHVIRSGGRNPALAQNRSRR